MAQRRMFSKEITNSSEFLMMSQSAQNLYFHFGMNSDDDWFCEVFTVMRMTDSKPDDLQSLHSRWFIFVIDNKVCIVKDWHENNQIRLDRHKKSKYLDDPKYMEIYSIVMQDKIKDIELYKRVLWWWQPNGNQMVPQVRLGKDRIDNKNTSISLETDKPKKENNTIKNIDAKFEEFRNIYPNKKWKANARILWAKIKWVDYDVIINACKLFAIENKWQDIKYIKHWNTWLSQQCWEDYKTIDREALKREMYNTWHEDTEDEPNTAHWKNMKDKYMLFWENWYDIRMEDKQEVKHTKKQERLLAHNQPTQW